MTSWIVRGILALIALQAGICTLFLAEEWPLLRNQEEGLFRHFLSASRMGRQFVIDESPNRERVRIVRPIKGGELRPILRIDVNEDPTREFESYPLSPGDWSVLLTNALTSGSRVAAIETPISWEDAGEIPLRALDRIIGQFEQTVLTVDLRRAPVGQARPVWLHRSGVPIENVRGNAGLLPRVNRVVIPPSATGAPNALFSFRLLESESTLGEKPDEGSFPVGDNLRFLPAFAVWDDILIPSFPVAIAMAHYGVAPEEVRVLMGGYIRIGDAGPIIAIDEFGQLAYPLVDKPQYSSAEAASFSPDFVSRELSGSAPRLIVFTDATRNNPSPWSSPSRLMRFISSIDALPQPEDPEVHPRFPLWGEVLFLALVAITGPLLLRLSKILMPVMFVTVVLLSIVCLGVLLHFQQTWMPLAPVVVTGLAGGILAPRLAACLPRKPNLPA